MSVVYVDYYGRCVSREWAIVLRAADAAGVRFTVTSGHRSMGEQQRLYDLYRSGRGNLAAVPSSNAPHIRVGRSDHAIDVNALDGGAARLSTWLRASGVRAAFPVRGEPWHIEVPAADLRALASRLGNPHAPRRYLTARERRLVIEIRSLRKHRRDVARRSEIKAWLRARANELVRLERDSPSPKAHRKERINYLRDIAFARIP